MATIQYFYKSIKHVNIQDLPNFKIEQGSINKLQTNMIDGIFLYQVRQHANSTNSKNILQPTMKQIKLKSET